MAHRLLPHSGTRTFKTTRSGAACGQRTDAELDQSDDGAAINTCNVWCRLDAGLEDRAAADGHWSRSRFWVRPTNSRRAGRAPSDGSQACSPRAVDTGPKRVARGPARVRRCKPLARSIGPAPDRMAAAQAPANGKGPRRERAGTHVASISRARARSAWRPCRRWSGIVADDR